MNVASAFKTEALLAACFKLVSYLAYFSVLKMEKTCFSEHTLTFNGLHSIVSLKTELFITAVVRTSNPVDNLSLTTLWVIQAFQNIVVILSEQVH
jgi:hypothetical protein